VASASKEAAAAQREIAADQLSWSREQWAEQWPVTQRYMESMVGATDAQLGNAARDRARYEGTFQPLENQLVRTAQEWNTPARASQEAGRAMADVAQSFEAQRKTALSTLESYGIDPSQTRFGALDLGTRVAQAAATSAAGTQARRNTEATGLSLLGEAINIGKGYPGQVAQSYGGATTAGQAGVNAGVNTAGTYGQMMGSPLGWAGASNQVLGNWGNTMNQNYQNSINAAKVDNDASGNMMSGIGSLIGGAIGLAMM